jgi:sulfate adenylyltransferase subunit 1 (EFTu-like GTPase family)
MAEFNSCASLIKDKQAVEEIAARATGKDLLQDMLDMQNKLQEVLAEKLPLRNIRPEDIRNKGQLIDWLDGNFDAIMDEFRELKTSIGGMSNGEKNASAVWKKWKGDNIQQRDMHIVDMTKEDHLEMIFEMIDIMHFVLNMLLAFRLSSKDIHMLYMLKNLENARRYNSGY